MHTELDFIHYNKLLSISEVHLIFSILITHRMRLNKEKQMGDIKKIYQFPIE